MDWNTFTASVVSSTLLIGVLAWLSKTWIGTRIKASIENEYNEKLETLKSQLKVETTAAIKGMESSYQDSADEKAADKSLFVRMVSILPSEGSIYLLQSNNFAGFAFREERLDHLKSFMYTFGGPESEFLDKDLESARESLYTLITDFFDYINLNTFPTNGVAGLLTVPPEWEIDNPAKFSEVVGRIHELAGQVVAKHTEFVRIGKKKLKISLTYPA